MTATPVGASDPATMPTRRRGVFHSLPVKAIVPVADGAVSVTFAVPDHLREEYRFAPGQHLGLRMVIDGEQVRRTYSICDPAPRSQGPAPATLRVGVRRLSGGAFSAYAHEQLKVGEEIDVMTPQGLFTADIQPTEPRHHVAFAAGSGITPIISMIATILRDEPHSTFTLVYGNQRASTVMFLEELAGLKDVYPTAFQIIHVLSREPHQCDLLTGRLEPAKIEAIIGQFLPAASIDAWYLCGPFEMVKGAKEVLESLNVPAERVHTELFYVSTGEEKAVETAPPVIDGAHHDVTVKLDGRETTFTMAGADESILDATLKARPDAPYSCTGGVCGTCRAKVVQGEVTMKRNYALEPDEVERGMVLACQSYPASDTIVLDYDS